MVVLLAAGAAAGGLVLELSGEEIAGAIAGGAVSWSGFFLARRLLARAGRRSFEGLPSADFESIGPSRYEFAGRMGGMAGWGVAVGAIYLALDAFGVAGGEWVGVAAGFPVWNEIDARIGLRARRSRTAESRRLRRAVDEGAGTVVLAEELVGVRRVRAVLVASMLVVMALGFGAMVVLWAVVGPDLWLLALVLAAAPILGSRIWWRAARAPFFLRCDAHGIDLLGAGAVPWDAVEAVAVPGAFPHWLELVLGYHADPKAASWFTPAHKVLHHDGIVRASLMTADRPKEEVLAVIRAHYDGPIDLHGDEEALEGGPV